LVFHAPAEFSEDENAAFLVNYMTAWVALIKLGKIQKEEKVLIQAAAGGVGTAAVQIAKAVGSEVFGTASEPAKLELLNRLGVDHPINYRTDDFYDYIKSNSEGMDVVLEMIGGEVFKKSLALLNPFGRMVVAGYASIPLKKWNPLTYWPAWRDAPKVNVQNMAIGSYGILATHIGYLTSNPSITINEWSDLLAFCQKHQIKPIVGHTFSFDQIPEAHALIESRRSTGKVVIRVTE
jgi:NADPH2:quinone reductase